MKYTILEASSGRQLSRLVNEFITDGWDIQGGVSVTVDQGRQTYVQAMIKD